MPPRWLVRLINARCLVLVLFALVCYLLISSASNNDCQNRPNFPSHPRGPADLHMNTQAKRGNQTYNRSSPVIFVGGMPRSGTTLMRVILDAHPFILCGEETRVVPRILQMRTQWGKSKIESTRLHEAGITDDVLDSAVAAFVIEILAKHASTHVKSMLCDKDPFNLKQMVYLEKLFPKSKFLLMIRDGRATSHSIITRKVTISVFDITSYRDVLTKWNRAIGEMWSQCEQVGEERCLPVWYEQLVLQPNKTVRQIASFLGVPWHDSMLHHQDSIGKNISVSKVERSTDQVAKPVNLDGLTSWVGHIPTDVEREMATIAPMLLRLGYDPYNPKPRYGEPDEIVKANMRLMEEHPEMFKMDTFRVDKTGKISKGQPGQEEMEAIAAQSKLKRRQ